MAINYSPKEGMVEKYIQQENTYTKYDQKNGRKTTSRPATQGRRTGQQLCQTVLKGIKDYPI